MATLGSRITVSCLAALAGAPVAAQGIRRVSVDSSGAQADFQSATPSISADGRFVAFASYATNLVPGDVNGTWDVFVRDRTSGTTELVSVDSSGLHGNGDSRLPSISADGRYVAFQSFATNLVAVDSNPAGYDVFLRDRLNATTEVVSVDSAGAQGHGSSLGPVLSPDGRYLAFYSDAADLVPGDTNGSQDVFVRDLLARTTERVSVAGGGIQGNLSSLSPAISADGRFVAFTSFASNLVAGDTNERDVFVRDRVGHTTERVSVSTGGSQAAGISFGASISGDGRYVAFTSDAENLVAGDTNLRIDAFVRDRQAGTTERASLDRTGGPGDEHSYSGSISPDGRYVAFYSLATDLVLGDTNGHWDVFVLDRLYGTTERASLDTGGGQGNANSDGVSISADGRTVAFQSLATGLVAGDTNGARDVFVRDRDAPNFSSLCDPGAGGYAFCPCSNAPAGPTRGCDNSSGTGGAVLSASGLTRLSSDSLVFTTVREKPSALSIVLQGNAFLVGGAPYGQGIRCVSGSLKRLYAKSAVSGSITAPDFGAGDPTVSARSAAKGDTIQAGQSRWYTVYYRDPVVLGGCPPSSTFNATQTGQVTWSL